MPGHKLYDERVQDFKNFSHSNEWGDCQDPDTGLVHYRGGLGCGVTEFSYDPDKEEVINGIAVPIRWDR